MQTTTTVSADVPVQKRHITKDRSLWIEEATRVHDADDHYLFRGEPTRIQKSMDRGDAVPRYRRPLLFPLTCQYRRHITKDRSLWIEEATRLHDADDHYRFRGHTNKNTKVYGSGRRDSTLQTTTAVSADVPAQTQHREGYKSMDRGSDASP